MKKINALLAATSCYFLFILVSAGADYVPGEILLKFKPAINTEIRSSATYEKAMERIGLRIAQLNARCKVPFPEIKKWDSRIDSIHLKFPPETDIMSIIKKYRSDPEVEYADPNYIRRVFATIPDDTKYPQQWGLTKIMADYAWDIEKGDTSIIVAVLDTGIDSDHPDLASKLISGYDFINDDSEPVDDNGHGTHVAGIIGAITNNGTGVAGVSWYCRIMPVKVMGADGSGSDAQLKDGILYASGNGAKILNMSLGSPDSLPWYVQAALDRAHDESNCILIAAAGNDGVSQENFPAAYSKCIAVGATDEFDGKAIFSNYGSWVDVCAPGTNIWSTMPNHWVKMNTEGYPQNYASLNGTSMATPFVSGVAALIFAHFGTVTPNTEVEYRIKRAVDDIGIYGLGSGRINAALAVGNYLTSVNSDTIVCWPNPLNLNIHSGIKIKNIPLTSRLSIRIYNIAGELVRNLDEKYYHLTPGYFYAEWDGRNDYNEKVSAGVYLAVISDGKRTAVKKIMLLK